MASLCGFSDLLIHGENEKSSKKKTLLYGVNIG